MITSSFMAIVWAQCFLCDIQFKYAVAITAHALHIRIYYCKVSSVFTARKGMAPCPVRPSLCVVFASWLPALVWFFLVDSMHAGPPLGIIPRVRHSSFTIHTGFVDLYTARSIIIRDRSQLCKPRQRGSKNASRTRINYKKDASWIYRA